MRHPVPGKLLIRGTILSDPRVCYDVEMYDPVIHFVHVIAYSCPTLGPGGVCSVVAEPVLVSKS
jgi:hypothetical protein